MAGTDPDTDEVRRLPQGLWERLRQDPVRAPEHLALAAAERHGPAAAAWVRERRAFYAYGPAELASMAVKRHVHQARLSGAATGLGGIVTLIPDMAALAWIQSRMVFYVAAAFGFDPLDPMRPAELLTLHEVYPDPATARHALDGVGTPIALAYAGSRLSRDEQLLKGLGAMAGRAAARRVFGKAIPGFAVAVNAVGNARDTRRLGGLAIRFYAAE